MRIPSCEKESRLWVLVDAKYLESLIERILTIGGKGGGGGGRDARGSGLGDWEREKIFFAGC